MKNSIFLLFILLFVLACSLQKKAVQVKINNPAQMAEDSLEYDLETFDLKFESWYELNKSPANFRSQVYYENWNRQYVSAWNAKAIIARNSFFEPIIGYNPTQDYGFELNHELFSYFQYVENVLKIEIMPNGPKTFPF